MFLTSSNVGVLPLKFDINLESPSRFIVNGIRWIVTKRAAYIVQNGVTFSWTLI